MADGNGSLSDQADNRSLDAADTGGGPSGSTGDSNSLMSSSEHGGRYRGGPGQYEARVIDTPLVGAPGKAIFDLPGRQIDLTPTGSTGAMATTQSMYVDEWKVAA